MDFHGTYAFLPVGHEDDVEKVVLVPEGRKADLMTVAGLLTVRDHPPAVVSGVNVPAWAEVRVR